MWDLDLPGKLGQTAQLHLMLDSAALTFPKTVFGPKTLYNLFQNN